MSNNNDSAVSISLPSGGGAQQGIGETFSPNLFTGTGNFSVPISTTPGRSGFGPQLSLNYSTGKGNGPFGLGWDISIPRITRKTEHGLPQYTNDDVFVLSASEDLVLSDEQLSPNDLPNNYSITRYRPRTEGLFARIEKWTKTAGENPGDIHWRIVTKDNITNIYGKSFTARISDPDYSQHTYQWLLEETFDNKGNHMLFEYIQEDPHQSINKIFEQHRSYSQTYIRRIIYGNTPDSLSSNKKVGHTRVGSHHLNPTETLNRHYLFELLFDYGDITDLDNLPAVTAAAVDDFIPATWPVRDDAFSSYRFGFEIRTLRRCQRTLMLHHFPELEGSVLVRSTSMRYENNLQTKISMLIDVQVSGHQLKSGSYYTASLPPLDFQYSNFEPKKQHYQSIQAKGNDLPPQSLNQPAFTLVDLFGDALPDIIQTTEQQHYYWRNLGEGKLDQRHVQHGPIPAVSTEQPGVVFADTGGDGITDLLVQEAPLTGFYESTPDGQWQNFKLFENIPSVDFNDPNLRLLDLTGDGLSDILITRDHHFLWYQSLGEAGYDQPQHINRIHDLDEFPDLFFDDATGRIRLADLTGDGLMDIVFIHDGRIEYWPNMGYGHFGKRITMANSPRFPWNMDPKRIFLADLDGSGCADLVYVDFDHVNFWFNQTGNSWSEKETIAGTPITIDSTALQFSDFFGTGTTALIWSDDYQQQSASHYKVLDFCGGKKPHLLTQMNNNMGATTRVQYASSTKFYLEDEKDGNPWATNLPMPVQVVEKSESIDHISKMKLVTTYKYHHGYYDGREREFRGFGRVDQYDTEQAISFAENSLHDDPIIAVNTDAAYHVPPVLTKTWFHTGVYFDDDNVSPSGNFYDHRDLMEAYSHEFYQGDANAFVLDNHDIEHSDNPHEAYRVLRGAQMRNEVFGLDETQAEDHPYIVSENRYQVKELQSKNGNRHGVFLAIERESINYHYERNPQDPRIAQNLTLNADEYGQVTDALSIAYPRRNPHNQVPEQAMLKLVYTHVDLINKVDDLQFYYLGVPYQTRTYEISGASWAFNDPPLTAEMFIDIQDTSALPGNFLQFQQQPSENAGLEKRLVEWSRSYFRRDDSATELDIAQDAQGYPTRTLNNRLALGEIESLALPYESYTAANSDDLLTDVFADVGIVSASMLREGGYHREPDLEGYWWIPSGQQTFDSQHFYVSTIARDPFRFDTIVGYDEYVFSTVETRDALDNTTQAEINYRILQPSKVTDSNGNLAFAAYDTQGMVVATAIQSKTGEGDTLQGFVADLSDIQIQEYLLQPELMANELLAGASSRIIYDPWAYYRSQVELSPVPRPQVVATISRETHNSELAENEPSTLQHSFLYSDGFGRAVQTKMQAEPDSNTPNQARWVSTGTTLYNNKGETVRQFESFFSDSHTYGIEQHGVSPTLFYDPLDRVVCTLLPNHSYSKVVFDPWWQETWDSNDTIHSHLRWDPNFPNDLPPAGYNPMDDPQVGHFFSRLNADEYLPTWYQQRMDDTVASVLWPDPARKVVEQDAAKKAARHTATPTVAHLDSLGRTVRTLADNGHEGQYQTSLELSIEGDQQAVIDALDRSVITYQYNIAGAMLKQVSMEAGTHWMISDITGNPFRAWDSRGHSFHTTYDPLRRPIESYMSEAGESLLVEKKVYGETMTNPEANNLRGQVVQIFDQAGVMTTDDYDFKANLLRSKRQLAQNYKTTLDWSAAVALEAETYTSSALFDALNRPIQHIVPHSDQPGTTINVIQPAYNEAGLLERVNTWLNQSAVPNNLLEPGTASLNTVTNINYDAKGQRRLIEYGNGTSTNYEYDPLSFRLVQLLTRRNAGDFPDDCPNPQPPAWPGCQVQDLLYTHDPAGNITHIRDDAQQTIFFKNKRVEPSADYSYDAIYRLIEASGREHLGQLGGAPIPHSYNDASRVGLLGPGDGNAMGNYDERYSYDAVGNILQMQHRGSDPSHPGWTRSYAYLESSQIEPAKVSNRLTSTTIGTNQETYSVNADGYDPHGNMLKMPQLQVMQWDYQDQLRMSQRQAVNTQDTDGQQHQAERTYYVYDASGQRIRKVTELGNGNPKDQRIYLSGFEIYRKHSGVNAGLVRETLHIMDDQQRITLVETRTHGNDPGPAQLIRYQLSNHLGSASLELDDQAQIISYQEYTPYGSTSYQAVRSQTETPNRYSYTGKERDEESGLHYHGARYYACWLGRWTAADPAGIADGSNLYAYVGGSPLVFKDPNGTEKTTYLGASRGEKYVERLRKTWGAGLHWADSGEGGSGWYVKTQGNKIVPASVRMGTTTVEPAAPRPTSQAYKQPWLPSFTFRPKLGPGIYGAAVPCQAKHCHQPGVMNAGSDADPSTATLMLSPFIIVGGVLLIPEIPAVVAVFGAAGAMAVTVPSDTSQAPANLGPPLLILSMGGSGWGWMGKVSKPRAGGTSFVRGVDDVPEVILGAEGEGIVLNVGGELEVLPGQVVINPGRKTFPTTKIRANNPENIVIEAGAESMPIGTGSVRHIQGNKLPTSVNSSSVDELWRVLEPGGSIEISFFGPHPEFGAALRAKGFSVQDTGAAIDASFSNIAFRATKPR